MFAGPLPRELKPPGDRVPARRPRGRVSPRTSLNPERRVTTRAPQAPACPRTRALFAADAPRFDVPLSSLDRSPRRAVLLVAPSRLAAPPSPHHPARCAVPLAVPPRSPPIRRVRRTARRAARCRSAFTHPTRWHSVSARSGSAQRAITPRQWNRYAITPRQFNRRAETPQQRSQRAETPQQRHHGPPADAYEPLAKRTSQELRPDLGC